MKVIKVKAVEEFQSVVVSDLSLSVDHDDVLRLLVVPAANGAPLEVWLPPLLVHLVGRDTPRAAAPRHAPT